MASLRSRPTEAETAREGAWKREEERQSERVSQACTTLSTRPRSLFGARKCLMCVYIETDCSTSSSRGSSRAAAEAALSVLPLDATRCKCLACCVLCEIVAVCNLLQMTLVVSTARKGAGAAGRGSRSRSRQQEEAAGRGSRQQEQEQAALSRRRPCWLCVRAWLRAMAMRRATTTAQHTPHSNCLCFSRPAPLPTLLLPLLAPSKCSTTLRG